MKLLYVGYWGIEETLTVATILPHLKALSAFSAVEEIVFCTIERNGNVSELSFLKVKHIPLFSKKRPNVFLTKIADYFLVFDALKKICLKYSIDLVICRSSLAGAFGHRLNRTLDLPYIVESFEPHRDYMVDSGVWEWYDLRSIIQSVQETQQKKSARYLLPVSNQYAAKLREEGIKAEKIIVLPCCVDTEKFRFDEEKRSMIRQRFSLPPDSVVGIYVGKFGGIYYWKEAFELYKAAFDFFGDAFRLIILSGHPHGDISGQLKKYSIAVERVILRAVSHDEVNEYLSASDFAFCTIKPAPSRRYCSPVKTGEYWANGLPVIMEPGIGDDSDIIEKEGGGVILKHGNDREAFAKIQKLLEQGRGKLAGPIRDIAKRHRQLELIASVYQTVLFSEEL